MIPELIRSNTDLVIGEIRGNNSAVNIRFFVLSLNNRGSKLVDPSVQVLMPLGNKGSAANLFGIEPQFVDIGGVLI